MDVRTLFPTRYIAADDLGGKSFVLTIKSVELEDMQSHDQKTVTKPVVKFSNAQKGLVLNKTNCMIIAALYGPLTEDWAGKRIEIYAARVKAFGSWTEAIRVREQVPPPIMPAPVAAPVAGDAADLDDLDEVTDVEADASIWDDAAPSSKSPDDITSAQLLRLTKLMAHVYGTDWGRYEAQAAQNASKGSVSRFSDLKVSEAPALIGKLEAGNPQGAKQQTNGKVAVS